MYVDHMQHILFITRQDTILHSQLSSNYELEICLFTWDFHGRRRKYSRFIMSNSD
jgi:hypothetical protein